MSNKIEVGICFRYVIILVIGFTAVGVIYRFVLFLFFTAYNISRLFIEMCLINYPLGSSFSGCKEGELNFGLLF